MSQNSNVHNEVILDNDQYLSQQFISHLAMQPTVIQGRPNDPIDIFQGDLYISDDSVEISETCKIVYSFLPSPKITFRIENPTKFHEISSHSLNLRLPKSEKYTKAILTDFRGTDENITASGIINESIHSDVTEKLGRIRFHLFNFCNYYGDLISHGDGSGDRHSWKGRVRFNLGPWVVTLDSIPNYDYLYKQAEAIGGYIITHVGQLELRKEKNGLPRLFTTKAVAKALEVLTYVFTFANGARCPPTLTFGYRFLPSEVAWCLSPYKIANAQRNETWFVTHNPTGSFTFADKIFSLWDDKDEQGWLRAAINFYIEANRNESGVDIELAKSQIALELLTWVIARERQQLLSHDTFDHLPAADKIRLALLWAEIPTTIPDEMQSLKKTLSQIGDGKQDNLKDGPFVITAIRNSTIHPTAKNRTRASSLDDMARYQAWQLSQSYVELLILRLLDYRGPYMTRYDRIFKPGEDIRLWSIVPWTKGL